MRFAVVAAALASVIAVSQPASAVTTNCPGTAVTTDREFQTNTNPATTCLDYGPGNINGNPMNDPFLLANPGWMLLDNDDANNQNDNGFLITGIGTKEGTFSFTGALAGFKYALGLKSGNGGFDPDWAVFGLNGATSGGWKILNFNQTLSHAILYKMPVSEVPLPASLPLLFGALAGVGFIGRKRKAA